MPHHANQLPSPSDWTLDPHPLLDPLPTPTGLTALRTAAQAWQLPHVENAATLSSFLNHYRNHILLPIELPAIVKANQLTQRGFARDLIELDRHLAQILTEKDLATASRRVGRSRLRALLPLRDQRVVQRYWQAVEAGEADGWHVVVYGLTLQLFSLPLRQGLLGYANRSIEGFIESAAESLALAEGPCHELHAALTAPLADEVARLLTAVHPGPRVLA